jgi:hypothetical protein
VTHRSTQIQARVHRFKPFAKQLRTACTPAPAPASSHSLCMLPSVRYYEPAARAGSQKGSTMAWGECGYQNTSFVLYLYNAMQPLCTSFAVCLASTRNDHRSTAHQRTDALTNAIDLEALACWDLFNRVDEVVVVVVDRVQAAGEKAHTCGVWGGGYVWRRPENSSI